MIKNIQHGFRRGRSPQTNLIEFMDKTSKWVDEGKSVDVVYFDFSKAFDKVSHEGLAVKMEAAGIRGKVGAWICEWLNERRQRVVVEGVESDWERVESSVPQGTVLGGTLFILFVNDIADKVKAFTRVFADDTKIASVVETEEDARNFQRDIDTLMNWAVEWKMEFNIDKCKVMHIGKRNVKNTYTMGETKLAETTEEKDLGVWIKSDLKPSLQCERAAKAANATLGMIARSFHYRTRKVLIPLYKTFVRPKLEYAASAWNPWLQRDVEVLEKVQQRMVRMLSDAPGATYEERLEVAGLMSLKERRIRGDLIETFKTMNGFNRVERENWFRIQEESARQTRANTLIVGEEEVRRRELIVAERPKLETRKHFFTLRVEKMWNEIPDEIRMQKSINGFKNNFDKWRRTRLLRMEIGEEGREQTNQQESERQSDPI